MSRRTPLRLPARNPSPSPSNESNNGGGGGGWSQGPPGPGGWGQGPPGPPGPGSGQWVPQGPGSWGPNGGGPGAAAAPPGWVEGPARPLHRRPSRLVEQEGPYAGMHSSMVREALRVMPSLAAQGPAAVRNAALAPAGGAAAVDRWTEPVHIGLPTETIVLQAPVRIAEFNTLIQKSLDLVVVPVISSLSSIQINKDLVVELFTITDACITPPLRNFIEQLSARSASARIVIDTSYYERYLQRLRDTTHGEHRQAVIAQLQEEFSRQIPALPPAVAQDPSFLQRTWAYITRRAPPQPQQSIAQMFPPGGAWGGVAPAGAAAPVVGPAAAPVAGAPVGPIAPPGVAAAPLAAGAAYIPSDRAVAERSQVLERRLRKNYREAAEFVKNYRIPGQNGAVEKSPMIIRSLYCNILGVFVHFTETLIKTIAHRLNRGEGLRGQELTREQSTYAAQQDALTAQGSEVEVTLNTVHLFNFLSRDQIDSLLEQLILIMVNYMNISPKFNDLIPIVSQLYSLATIYTSVADLDQVRPNARLLTEAFSEILIELVSKIHVRAHNSMKKYVVNGDPWFASNGLLGKLGHLSSTLLKLVSEDKRVQVLRIKEDAARIRVVTQEQTRVDVAREAVGILSDIASPIFTGLDKLLELLDPTEFNETMAAADGTRRAVRGNLRVGGDEVLDVAQHVGGAAVRAFGDLNTGLVRHLGRIGATGAAETIVNGLVCLDDGAAAIVLRDVADQGGYQQLRAVLKATQEADLARPLEPTPVPMLAAQSVGMERGFTVQSIWGKYEDFDRFMTDLQHYSQAALSDEIYPHFQAYIASDDIREHLRHFTFAQLTEIYETITADERNDDWHARYDTLIEYVNAKLSTRENFTENYNNGRYNSNYEPSPSPSESNSNGQNYETEVFEGYYGWDDLTADLYSMVDYYRLEDVAKSATYRNWLTYVDRGFTTSHLPRFTEEQLDELLRHLRESRLTNDPLIVRIKRKITEEKTNRHAGGNTNSNVENRDNGPAQAASRANGTRGGLNGFEGYYGWDDLTEELFGMMRNYNGFTQSSPTYKNWLGYVDRGFKHTQIPKFTDDQLHAILTEIYGSPMRRDNLIQTIKQIVMNELRGRGIDVESPPDYGALLQSHTPAPAYVSAPAYASAPASASGDVRGGIDGFEGYYGWDDLSQDLHNMMMNYSVFTSSTPLYQSWLGYVDRGFTHYQLPKFTPQQLNLLVEEIDRSRMAEDPLMQRIRERTIVEMQRRGGGGGGGGGVNTGRWGNQSRNSSVSSTNNGYGNFWNENPVTYRNHINRTQRGNKTVEAVRSAKKHRKRLERRSQRATRSRSDSNVSNSSISSREKAYWAHYPDELQRYLSGDPALNRGLVVSAKKYTKSQKPRRTRNSNRARASAPRASAPRGSRAAADLEARIKMALRGELRPWDQGPDYEAKIYFDYGQGINEIENCNSIKLLTAIIQLIPNSALRKRMIAAARLRLNQVDTQNSYSPGSPFQ